MQNQSQIITQVLPLLYKARILSEFGSVSDALKCAENAMELCPNLTEAVYQAAQYNVLLGKSKESIVLLKKVIEIDKGYLLKVDNDSSFSGMKNDLESYLSEYKNSLLIRVNEELNSFNSTSVKLSMI